MSVSALFAGLPPIPPVGGVGAASGVQKPAAAGFGDKLESAVAKVDAAQHSGDAALQELAAGDADIHDVMIKLSEADITLQAATTARNKVVSAYEAIMNMAI
jgi:flagellar hook-basal body complex protein FliE